MRSLIESKKKRNRIIKFLLNKDYPPNKTSNIPEIVQIFTDPLIRNKGIGTKLLYKVEDFLKGKNLSQYYIKTNSSINNKAISFYLKNKFVEISTNNISGRDYIYYIKTI